MQCPPVPLGVSLQEFYEESFRMPIVQYSKESASSESCCRMRGQCGGMSRMILASL